ncbi:UNVERIFIED_ORG: hypothetical protein BDU10_8658 [Burkholderia sp. CF145]|nr:hypothetical protein PMI06_001516 [Burkholderia sp. BT03]SKC96420.1 hypothetical protein SAMN05445504_6899 [Burkholderia sp. CF099]SKD07027.1 hypothetical protein SAMN06266956_9547 [Paraburkholderia hospita]
MLKGSKASVNKLWKSMAIPSSMAVSVSSHAGVGNQKDVALSAFTNGT